MSRAAGRHSLGASHYRLTDGLGVMYAVALGIIDHLWRWIGMRRGGAKFFGRIDLIAWQPAADRLVKLPLISLYNYYAPMIARTLPVLVNKNNLSIVTRSLTRLTDIVI